MTETQARPTTITATLVNIWGQRRRLAFETKGRVPPFYVIHDGRLFCMSAETWAIPEQDEAIIACTYNETCHAHDATGAALSPINEPAAQQSRRAV